MQPLYFSACSGHMAPSSSTPVCSMSVLLSVTPTYALLVAWQCVIRVQVEAGMVKSMQEVCRKGLDAYAATPRSSWVLEWPSQVVLAVSSIYWTQEVAEAMQGRPAAGGDSAAAGQGGKGVLAAVAAKCTSQLNEVVELVRGELSVLNRCALHAVPALSTVLPPKLVLQPASLVAGPACISICISVIASWLLGIFTVGCTVSICFEWCRLVHVQGYPECPGGYGCPCS